MMIPPVVIARCCLSFPSPARQLLSVSNSKVTLSAKAPAPGTSGLHPYQLPVLLDIAPSLFFCFCLLYSIPFFWLGLKTLSGPTWEFCLALSGDNETVHQTCTIRRVQNLKPFDSFFFFESLALLLPSHRICKENDFARSRIVARSWLRNDSGDGINQRQAARLISHPYHYIH